MTMQRILPLAACLLGFGLTPALAASMPAPQASMPAPQASMRAPQHVSGQHHVSAPYTTALNTFMSHGWHAVDDMHMQNGTIFATAVNSEWERHNVAFDLSTGMVTQG